MLKKNLEALVRLYEEKDKVNAEINRSTWDDPFTSEPECCMKHRISLIDRVRAIDKEIDILKIQSE